MYLFNVTVNIDNNIKEKWLAWMYQKCEEFVNSGLVKSYKVLKPVNTLEYGGSTYAFQFMFEKKISPDDLEKEYNNFLGNMMHTLYKGKFAEFRTFLEIIKQ